MFKYEMPSIKGEMGKLDAEEALERKYEDKPKIARPELSPEQRELKRVAIQAEIEGLFDQITKSPADSRVMGWYWDAFETFQWNHDLFDIDQNNAFVDWLNENATKLGIKNKIGHFFQRPEQEK